MASNNISYYVGIAVTYILGMIMPWRVAAALSIGIALAKHKNRKNWNKYLCSLFENYALGIWQARVFPPSSKCPDMIHILNLQNSCSGRFFLSCHANCRTGCDWPGGSVPTSRNRNLYTAWSKSRIKGTQLISISNLAQKFVLALL